MARSRLIRPGTETVLTAATQRIKNIFENGCGVRLSFSGGKDSLSLLHLTLSIIADRPDWKSQLRVMFIDEEAIFPCVDEVVREWRQRCLDQGIVFEWYCLEVKHFNCFNRLTNDETFICWDSTARDRWVRPMPDFAIVDHPRLRRRRDSYQEFCERAFPGEVQVTGVRIAESVQRRSTISSTGVGMRRFHAIYDWTDKDVWFYLRQHKDEIRIPEAYLHMWELGINKTRLRISQFFSIDTAGSLVRMAEYYPHLMEKISAREPNAYLAALYWDSEMFRHVRRASSTDPGKPLEYYREQVLKMLTNVPKYFESKNAQWVAERYRVQILKLYPWMNLKLWKMTYEGLVAGDPKRRTLRAVITGAASARGVASGGKEARG